MPSVTERCWGFLVDILERMAAAGYLMHLPDDVSQWKRFA